MRVHSIFLQKLLMEAPLYDMAIANNQNLVAQASLSILIFFSLCPVEPCVLSL